LDRNSISLVSIRVVCVARVQYFLHGSSDPPVFIGVGQSTPRIAFVKSAAERAILYATDLHIAEDDVVNTWALASVFGQLAEDRDRDDGYLRHMNTDNTARDMLRIVEAHGRTKIQYWGFS